MFSLYGKGGGSCSLDTLLAEQKRHGMFHARVESDGQNVFAEIAYWNDMASRWERYAFVTCDGGPTLSHGSYEELTANEEAQRLCSQINAYHSNDMAQLVSRMPDYSGDDPADAAPGEGEAIKSGDLAACVSNEGLEGTLHLGCVYCVRTKHPGFVILQLVGNEFGNGFDARRFQKVGAK